MKIEGTIKQLESILDHTRSMAAEADADEIWKEDIAALEFAITALRSMQEAGEPLSLEQLREMDGKPVYEFAEKRWFVVKEVFTKGKPKSNKYDYTEITMTDGTVFSSDLDYDEISNRFYSCPPAHIDRSKWEKIVTNADRIRAMSDEELADFLDKCEGLGYADSSIAKDKNECNMNMLDWLRQPAKEE